MKTKSTRGGARENSGGARKGAGRKPGPPRVAIGFHLSPATVERIAAAAATLKLTNSQVVDMAVDGLTV